jgi:hypothetical protein
MSFSHIVLLSMAAPKFDLAAFLAWSKVPAPVLLRGVPNAVPKHWRVVVATKHGFETVWSDGSMRLCDCTHFYSIREDADSHMVEGYVLSPAEIAEYEAWHAAHPPLQLS